MISDDRKREIVASFQASFKSTNSTAYLDVPLSDLMAADEMIGNVDIHSGYRLRMRNRIAELLAAKNAAAQSRQRFKDQIVGFVLGAITALLGVGATHLLSRLG